MRLGLTHFVKHLLEEYYLLSTSGHIMACGSTPYAGMAPKKMAATLNIKSAQMTRSKCLRQISQRAP